MEDKLGTCVYLNIIIKLKPPFTLLPNFERFANKVLGSMEQDDKKAVFIAQVAYKGLTANRYTYLEAGIEDPFIGEFLKAVKKTLITSGNLKNDYLAIEDKPLSRDWNQVRLERLFLKNKTLRLCIWNNNMAAIGQDQLEPYGKMIVKN